MVDDPRCILVFGGTFDPPHRAHIVLPPLVAKQLGCSFVLYIPAALNPLKTDAPPTADHHRLAMLRVALSGVQGIEIDTIELDRAGPSYMVDTLTALQHRYGKGVKLRLLIGADQAVQFHRWRDWKRILELAPPAVMLRPPFTHDAYVAALKKQYTSSQVEQWASWTIPLPMIDVSSTEIRQRITTGSSLEDILNPPVIEYIQEHGLYRD